jgi:basic amino acid/polyamine antiporter, APA family
MQKASAGGLGVFDAALLVVGSIVGGGIFLVSHDVAHDVRSPGVFFAAWILGGAVALAGALSNGELGGMFPRSGGEYVYLREAYGPTLGFLSGWTSFWIAFPGSIAALAFGLGFTLSEMFGVTSAWFVKGVGVASIVVLSLVNAAGLRPGKWVNNALSGTKLAAFAALLGVGLLFGRAPAAVAEAAPAAGAGLGAALIPVLFAYSGWNAATYVAGEMRDPARGLGRALALGTFACIVLYLAVNATYLRAMPLAELAATDGSPARITASRLGGAGAAALLSPLIAVCISSSLQATVLVGPRIYQAMAADGLFFESIGGTHPATGVPVVGFAAQAIIAAAELLTGSFDRLLTFAMFSIVAFSTLTVGAVMLLRLRRPELGRPFRVPGYPVVPALFVLVNAWVLWSVVTGPYLRDAMIGVAIVVTGVPAYAAFRARSGRRPGRRGQDGPPPPLASQESPR